MEFVGKIKIESNKDQHTKKNWLTIGIVAIIVAIIIEIAIGVFYILSLLIPLAWLLKIRNTMGTKSLLKDVAIIVDEDNKTMSFLIKNSVYMNKMLVDRKIIIQRSQIESIIYLSQSGKMIFQGNSCEEYIAENETLKSIECSDFCFYISKSDFSHLLNKYSLADKVSIVS